MSVLNKLKTMPDRTIELKNREREEGRDERFNTYTERQSEDTLLQLITSRVKKFNDTYGHLGNASIKRSD